MTVLTHRFNQKGDTIVEVLIAITVAASVLAVGLSTMNRNLVTTRNNQERLQASKLVQGQIELLKAASDLKTPLPAAGVSFCLTSATTYKTGSDCDDFDTLFDVRIKESTSEPDLFNFSARWDKIGTNVGGVVDMAYKL